VKPRNQFEWIQTGCAAVMLGLGAVNTVVFDVWVGVMTSMVGVYMLLNMWRARRSFLDGWLSGRRDLMMMMQVAGEKDWTSEQFMQNLIGRDQAVMKDQLGEREFQKMMDAAFAQVAREHGQSDGSHDRL
jgi:hypothetical protein